MSWKKPYFKDTPYWLKTREEQEEITKSNAAMWQKFKESATIVKDMSGEQSKMSEQMKAKGGNPVACTTFKPGPLYQIEHPLYTLAMAQQNPKKDQ